MKQNFLRTRFEWLDALAARSSTIAQMGLKGSVSDEIYKASGQSYGNNTDAFNFANSENVNTGVARSIEGLNSRNVGAAPLRKLVSDLTSRNTFGTFCEINAYDFLLRGGHDFSIQAPVTASDILNPNGSDLDGLLSVGTELMYFDIKAFGFHEHIMRQLHQRLSADLAPKLVSAEDSWDVPISLLSDLQSKGYTSLRDELAKTGRALRDPIRFMLKEPTGISFSTREIDVTRLADNNADYAFRFAKQFARHKPFFLFFVMHPWATGALHVNFGGSLDEFTRSFAENTFLRFKDDTTPTFDVTRAEASRLLTGIVFIDAWPEVPGTIPKSRCFLNPLATNPLLDTSIAAFAAPYGADMGLTTIP